jgi:hypothetical protein
MITIKKGRKAMQNSSKKNWGKKSARQYKDKMELQTKHIHAQRTFNILKGKTFLILSRLVG